MSTANQTVHEQHLSVGLCLLPRPLGNLPKSRSHLAAPGRGRPPPRGPSWSSKPTNSDSQRRKKRSEANLLLAPLIIQSRRWHSSRTRTNLGWRGRASFSPTRKACIGASQQGASTGCYRASGQSFSWFSWKDARGTPNCFLSFRYPVQFFFLTKL